MAHRYLITTDSSCDLNLNECRRISVIPICMKYTDGEKTYLDTMVDSDTLVFYREMRNGSVFKTSQVNIEEYLQFFRPLLVHGMPIMHISLGSGISGSYQNSCTAAQMLREECGANIVCIDGLGASLCHGLLAVRASENRDAGLSFDDNVADILKTRHHVHPVFTTDTLTYLARGGRVTPLSAAIGNRLAIKPILRLDAQGHLFVGAKAIGRNAALRKIIEHVRKTVIAPENQVLYIGHGDAIESAAELSDVLMKEFKFKEVRAFLFGSTIGAHTGPGLQCAFYLGSERV